MREVKAERNRKFIFGLPRRILPWTPSKVVKGNEFFAKKLPCDFRAWQSFAARQHKRRS
jgi:hypothetical protein